MLATLAKDESADPPSLYQGSVREWGRGGGGKEKLKHQ